MPISPDAIEAFMLSATCAVLALIAFFVTREAVATRAVHKSLLWGAISVFGGCVAIASGMSSFDAQSNAQALGWRSTQNGSGCVTIIDHTWPAPSERVSCPPLIYASHEAANR